ncbi:Protein CDV3 [Tupaia chinensis]|uniref:Protein CDV3 n=1 Tax=Tupaia chinensis TaxID=246437 RepID=L9KGU4_TUPCH|nr:Protein CDV3 [Tupaia chinensis]
MWWALVDSLARLAMAGHQALSMGPGAAAKIMKKDEDEWEDFKQKEFDYSGLRVQAMLINEKEDDNEKREGRSDTEKKVEDLAVVVVCKNFQVPGIKVALVQVPPASKWLQKPRTGHD